MKEDAADTRGIPSFAWKEASFVQEYSRLVDDALTVLSNGGHQVDVDMMCVILHQSGQQAFQECFPDRELNPHSKSWWTPELSEHKLSLATHFNEWKQQNFPRDSENVFFNRYVLARKTFRKAVKNAQNKKIYDSLHKMNSLKNTHPQKFWSRIRQLRKNNSKRQFEVNGKNTEDEITEEFADNFNALPQQSCDPM